MTEISLLLLTRKKNTKIEVTASGEGEEWDETLCVFGWELCCKDTCCQLSFTDKALGVRENNHWEGRNLVTREEKIMRRFRDEKCEITVI